MTTTDHNNSPDKALLRLTINRDVQRLTDSQTRHVEQWYKALSIMWGEGRLYL